MTKTLALVADVGGTNTRLALADADGLVAGSTQRFANAAHDGFAATAQAYLDGQDTAQPSAMCVAIAGPVTGGKGQLTNRPDWVFDADRLGADLGIPQVKLANDLAALGYALPDLPPRVIHQIGGAGPQGPQALVVGVATGFNVALCLGDQVYEAELGHASLPSSVMAVLVANIGNGAQHFTTVESLFCGRGIEQLHQLRGNPAQPATDITAQNNGTLDLFAQALGLMCRELMYQYLPLGGVYFNGSLARAVLQGQGADKVAGHVAQDAAFDGRFGQVPLSVITEDTAALYGCARVLRLAGA